MPRKYPPIHYHEYLKLDSLLDCQRLVSEEYKQPAHDEMLFIIVHQTYELWFKQILNEVDSVVQIFKQKRVADHDMEVAVSRLQRVTEIQKLLIDQIRVLETMTPLDFLEFREMLFPASGFQSFQFRALEVKLGLPSASRLKYNSQTFHESLTQEQSQAARQLESEPTLFSSVESWLERTPFLKLPGFDFWQNYRSAVEELFERDREYVKSHSGLSPEDIKRNLQILESSQTQFATLFDERDYDNARGRGVWRLSYKALHAALFIQLYRDQPVLQLPFRLLTSLVDIDELMTSWRYRHALMAKRMLGSKIGTGGSSGYEYLKSTSEQHKVFQDLFQLTTFYIPRSDLPKLPAGVEKELGFYYSSKT